MMRYFNQIIITIFLIAGFLHAQMIHRYGTTTGNFLEIGVDKGDSLIKSRMAKNLTLYQGRRHYEELLQPFSFLILLSRQIS